jgi:ABC-2 type transport system ATP-binding protein
MSAPVHDGGCAGSADSAGSAPKPPAIISVEGLRRRFGSFEAVRGVSFSVEAGEIFGYLGANGAGKSTTIRILCGLLAPSAGRATVAGHDVGSDPEGVRRVVGYMSQRFSLYPDLTPIENLDFFGGAYGLPRSRRLARARELLADVDLDPATTTPTGQLPGGMRQRLALVGALLHAPAVVFLDEPTAGVDPGARRTFWRIIRRLAAAGTTIFVTTHYMDEAEYCHRVGMMVDGSLVALDTPAGLKTTWVPGRLYAARGQGLSPAAVRALPGVREVEPFGAGLHVRAEGGSADEHAITAALIAAGGGGVHVEAIPPTLEDVFLAVARRPSSGATP